MAFVSLSRSLTRGRSPTSDEPHRRREEEEEEEEERWQAKMEYCPANTQGRAPTAQDGRRRGEQVDSDAESPEETDWSVDDDEGDDDHDREEHIDWALLSHEEGEGSGAGVLPGPPVVGAIAAPPPP